MRRALFLDRDGTLMLDRGYVKDPGDVELISDALPVLNLARSLGFELVVVSNQSGVGRGLITVDEFERVQARLVALLAAEDVRLDDSCFCFHTPTSGCACRKPAPGLLQQVATRRGLDLSASWLVGDKPTDVQAGRAAGCTTVLLGSGPCAEADHVVAAWAEVATLLAATGQASPAAIPGKPHPRLRR